MELTVLGCHGGETPKHRTSSFLIDGRIALDAGAITGQLSLREQQQIHTVIVSHAHLDHVRDLASLVDNRCQQGGPTLTIAGIPAAIRDLRAHFFNDRLWPDFTKIPAGNGPTVAFRELELEQAASVAGISVTPLPVHHTVDSAAFVLDRDGKAIAYSGDTGPTDRLWKALDERRDVQALIVECSFPNEMSMLAVDSGHHTPETLSRDLAKLSRQDLALLVFHIKPVFQSAVERELAKLKTDLSVLRLEEEYRW